MLSAGQASAPRRAAAAPPPSKRSSPSDVSQLVGWAAVVLTLFGVTAVLTTVAHQPGGIAVVGLVTKPSPLVTLLVQGGLGLVGLVLVGRFCVAGIRRWRGGPDADGLPSRAGAIFLAAIAGGVLFAAVELIRVIWEGPS
jgi:hypothetical protein